MRDEIVKIIQSAMDRAVSDTKAGIAPPDPHLYADLILALKVEGRMYCSANTESTGECFEVKRCNKYAGGKRLCNKMPKSATIADLIEVK